MLVDGVELEAQWSDMFWRSSWNEPNGVLEGTRDLSEGPCRIEAYGFEPCCDAAATLEVRAPGSTDWTPLTN